MAGRIPAAFIDDLLARTDIVELIRRRLPLRRVGKNYQTRCPFHEEKTPSFIVNPEKQFFHCFGCGAHGSAIGFLMDYEQRDFREAVEELAQIAGLEVPSTQPRGPDHRPLYELMARAARLFQEQLRQHSRAQAYLRERGVAESQIEFFGLGYAPPRWDFLLQRLGSDDQHRRRLIACGLVVEQGERCYDRFRNRLLFPIRDRRGRCLGFGGRLLGEGQPKYLNSPETPLFHKRRMLYGWYEAQRKGAKRLILVEGYLDVIALDQFGISGAVASLGTALSSQQLQALRTQAQEIIFCFDGDQAGRSAARKALETALPQATGDPPLSFLFLPEGEDPDSLVRKEGKAAFEKRLEQALPLSDYFFQSLEEGLDLRILEGRAQLVQRAKPRIEQVPAGIFQDLLWERLRERTGIALDRLRDSRPQKSGPPSPPRPKRATPVRLLVALILQNPELARVAQSLGSDWRDLKQPGIDLLQELLDFAADRPNLTAGALLEHYRNHPHYPYLVRLADPQFLEHIPESGLAAELQEQFARLNRAAQTEKTREALRQSIALRNP